MVIVLFTGTAIVVASKVGIAQKAWIDKIQLRISATASLLGAMTPIKMTGLTQSLSRKIRKLRENEIKSSYGYRVVLMCIVSLTFASTALTPVASFGVYILLQQYRGYAILDPTITLTTLTLIQLLLAPVSILIDALSGLTSAMGCLERIRQYLLSETRVDGRIVKRPVTERMWNNHESIGNLMRSSSSRRVSAIELRPIAPRRYSNRGLQLGEINSHRDSAVFYRASFGWKGGEKPILKELSLKLPKGKLTMVVGPVGSGKSTFLQTLLGETQSSGDGGYIQVSFEDAAYCQQRPWISNQTIRQNILGCFGFDPEWYYEVIQACCLARDLDLLPEGDVTKVGSHGASLSGGQQARIALARAIYSKKKTMILDDVLSGLDASTIDAVFSSLFAWDGLLRRHKVTVVLATNDVHLLPSSDHIIVLGSNGAITEQGSFGTLYSRSGYISGLNLQKLPHDGRTKNGGDGPEHGSLATNEALARALPQLRAPDGVSGGELATYKYYIESFGWVRWWIFISICSFYGFGVCFPHAWAQMWATHNIQYPGDKAGYYIGIYFLIAALTVLSLGAGCG